jgi:hypothetical protein
MQGSYEFLYNPCTPFELRQGKRTLRLNAVRLIPRLTTSLLIKLHAGEMFALGHKRTFLDVRFSLNEVRFTPKSGHPVARSECLLSANSGHGALRLK